MGHRDMSEETRIQLRRSEIVDKATIYMAASKIYAAFVANGLVNEDNQKAVMKKSVGHAIELALATDTLVATAGDCGSTF